MLMIGFIALSGIIVRNSILLVEFARGKVGEGWDVPDAILAAGRVRLRPILITALALVIGSMVLLSDPIFQGMAVSLLFGSLVATFLTLVVIPLGCVSARKYFIRAARHRGPDDMSPPPGPITPGNPPPPPPPGGATRPPRLQRRAEADGASRSFAEAPPSAGPLPGAARPARLVKKAAAPDPEPPRRKPRHPDRP